ncbi:MAG: hypothetical protein EP338_01450 [Bacteroidetes bacterium]|nr:MAG: hypothetical protein EP338_01450 [Bacteroidota bacterium]
MHFTRILLFFVLIGLFSCKKKEVAPECPPSFGDGLLVLNEGLFQHNNSSLSWFSYSEGNVSNDFFLQKNGRLLGDTGNDLEQYGNKIYVIVTTSSTLEILDSEGKLIQQILMQDNGKAKQPRNIAFHGAYAFVSCFDGYVDVLDTAKLEIVQRIKVGLNPDQITEIEGRILVSNSGGLNAPLIDSTISIINPQTLLEERKITVGLNPGTIIGESLDRVHVLSRGNYSDVPAKLHLIDAINSSIKKTYSYQDPGMLSPMENNYLLSIGNKLVLFDPMADSVVNNQLIDLSALKTPYGLKYIPAKQEICLLDANEYVNTGKLLRYSSSGAFITSYNTALLPSKVIYIP